MKVNTQYLNMTSLQIFQPNTKMKFSISYLDIYKFTIIICVYINIKISLKGYKRQSEYPFIIKITHARAYGIKIILNQLKKNVVIHFYIIMNVYMHCILSQLLIFTWFYMVTYQQNNIYWQMNKFYICTSQNPHRKYLVIFI